MKRTSGVLLPITALTGPYGIGDLGEGFGAFVDLLDGCGFSVWQVLPLTVPGDGNSPYSGVSAFAGNGLLIDINRLPERLITKEEKTAAYYNGSAYKVDYPYAKTTKRRLLKTAFSRLNEEDDKEIYAFFAREKEWLLDYAVYMAACEYYGGGLSLWDKALYERTDGAVESFYLSHKEAVDYYFFEQFLFFSQWEQCKRYAHSKGISIFGDMPIYVARGSVDVWANAHLFKTDKNGRLSEVAGVPPDYFAENGQLWGNPLYDYKIMAKDNYRWWGERIKHNMRLYDVLRIDHFRGLCEYWAVPAGAKTAKEGRWRKGPGMALWKALKNRGIEANIVAEDLGLIDDKVVKYLQKTGFPGMKVFQFAFDGNPDNPHLPYNYVYNSVAYTATHDNDTTLGWLYSLDEATRTKILAYLGTEACEWWKGGSEAPAVQAVIKEMMKSVCKLAVFPIQDLLGYGTDTRVNIPGVPEGNWEYRVTWDVLKEINIEKYLAMNRLYGRTDK